MVIFKLANITNSPKTGGKKNAHFLKKDCFDLCRTQEKLQNSEIYEESNARHYQCERNWVQSISECSVTPSILFTEEPTDPTENLCCLNRNKINYWLKKQVLKWKKITQTYVPVKYIGCPINFVFLWVGIVRYIYIDCKGRRNLFACPHADSHIKVLSLFICSLSFIQYHARQAKILWNSVAKTGRIRREEREREQQKGEYLAKSKVRRI